MFAKLALTITIFASLGWPNTLCAQGPQSDTSALLIAIRHADTVNELGDRALSAAGIARAQALIPVLQNAGVTAIFTSTFRRSRDTAKPTASAFGITLEEIPISRATLESHMKQLEAGVRRNKGGVVLVVGHDDSVPRIIAAFGGPSLPNLCSTVHSNLFLLAASGGKAHFVHARYGAFENDPGPDCK